MTENLAKWLVDEFVQFNMNGFMTVETFMQIAEYTEECDRPQEDVMELWAVNPYLGMLLSNHNQLVLWHHNAVVWGRTCSGQSIYCDRVIKEIAKSIEPKDNPADVGVYLNEAQTAALSDLLHKYLSLTRSKLKHVRDFYRKDSMESLVDALGKTHRLVSPHLKETTHE